MNHKPSVLVTHFACDRCSAPNAFRINVPMNEHPKQVDLCISCVISLACTLARNLPLEERTQWIENFKAGLIQ